MKLRHAITAALATGLLLGATACTGSSVVTTEPKKTAAAKTDEKPAAKPQPKASPKQDAKVGDTITVHGFEDGSQLDVTVTKWVDPAKSGDEFSAPSAGKRWVAAQFELVNTGTKVYSDSPSNGAQVADTQGQRFMSTIGDVSAGPSMTSSAKVPPGEKALGYIAFEVPKDSKVASVQFTMDSGMAEQTAQWKVS